MMEATFDDLKQQLNTTLNSLLTVQREFLYPIGSCSTDEARHELDAGFESLLIAQRHLLKAYYAELYDREE